MPEMGVRILGMEEAQAEIRRVQQGGMALGGYTASVGSPLVYAHGIHFGRHRGGKLARKAGGLFFLTGALEQVRSQPDVVQMLADGVRGGPGPARAAGRKLAHAVLARAKQLETAVDSGALRNSLQVVEGGGSARPVSAPSGPARRRSMPSTRSGRR